MISIDVVICSFRLQSKYLIPVIQMEVPADTTVRYLIIADDPTKEVPAELAPYIDNKKVLLFRNAENLGASGSRNVGIDNATADWILFLDDDVMPSERLMISYADAIRQNPTAPGFIGEVVYPAPVNAFTKGLRASGILALFSFIKTNTRMKWAPTANIMARCSAIGNLRFDSAFPKAGSGEDIDFCLRIYKGTKQELPCISDAQVYHDWWNNGKRDYKRVMRWSAGTSILFKRHPEYAYYSFPNLIEILLVGIPFIGALSFYFHTIMPLLFFCVGAICGEVFVEFVRLLIAKGLRMSMAALEVVMLRAASDITVLKNQLKDSALPKGIGLRFDFFCNGSHIAGQRVWSGLRFVSYIVVPLILFYMYAFIVTNFLSV